MATKAELTTGSASAATEHTEELQWVSTTSAATEHHAHFTHLAIEDDEESRQCATHGCEYPRAIYKGRLRTSCCHRCRYTNGREHNSDCVAYTSSSHHRLRSRSQDVVDGVVLEAVVPQVREHHRHCFVITLGLRGHFGMKLLEHNPDLRSNAIDARSLRDPGADQRGGPWGTCIETQQEHTL